MTHRFGFRSVPLLWTGIRGIAVVLAAGIMSVAGVTVNFPVSGSSVTPPLHIRASASSTHPVTYMRIYVDNISVYGVAASSLNTYFNIAAGSHYVVVQAWDSSGAVFKTPLNLTVKLLDGRHQLLRMPFLAGITHIAGEYGFTQHTEAAHYTQIWLSLCLATLDGDSGNCVGSRGGVHVGGRRHGELPPYQDRP